MYFGEVPMYLLYNKLTTDQVSIASALCEIYVFLTIIHVNQNDCKCAYE